MKKRMMNLFNHAIFLILGMIVWWNMTGAYRTQLPHEQIKNVEKTKNQFQNFVTLGLNIEIISVLETDNSKTTTSSIFNPYLKELYNAWKSDNEKDEYVSFSFNDIKNETIRFNLINQFRETNLDPISKQKELDDYIRNNIETNNNNNNYNTPSSHGYYRLYIFEHDQNQNTNKNSNQKFVQNPIVFGQYRHMWTAINHPSDINHILPRLVQKLSGSFDSGHIEVVPSLSHRLSFSLINEDPDSHHISWQFRKAAELFLMPMIHRLQNIEDSTYNSNSNSDQKYSRHDLDEDIKQNQLDRDVNVGIADLFVESQMMHYGDLPEKPIFNQQDQTYQVKANDIKLLLNFNDWKLESPASEEPLIHFLLYIPSVKHTPLRVLDYHNNPSPTNSFIIPRWGGVIFHNVDPDDHIDSVHNSSSLSDAHHIELTVQDLLPVMKVFIGQLRALLGLSSAPSLSHDQGIQLIMGKGIAEWEIDQLIRRRVRYNTVTAVDSLSSLSKLVHQMPNVLVKESVAQHTSASLHAISQSFTDCYQMNYVDAMKYSRVAFRESEAAFFHPSMLSLLYFPEEHLMAIYLPILLPLSVTVISGVIKEISNRRRKRKEQLKKEQQEQEKDKNEISE